MLSRLTSPTWLVEFEVARTPEPASLAWFPQNRKLWNSQGIPVLLLWLVSRKCGRKL